MKNAEINEVAYAAFFDWGDYMNKESLLAAAAVFGGTVSHFLGGFDSALQTLMIFMAADYITGITVAGVFHKSGKSENGSLESRAGFKGLCRKGLILLIVLVACRIDVMMNTAFLRDATIVAFVCNEALSIIENAGLMGIKVPKKLADAIDVLKGKEE